MKRCIGILLTACAIVVSGGSWADAPQPINWTDLTVKLPPGENPFAKLSAEQVEALADVAALRERRARGFKLTALESETERAASDKLKNAGIDADSLLARREEVAKKVNAIAGQTNPNIEGKVVRLPGYMLPLEFSGKRVTEFLLVPWVGACIHTPPPPANQIVHVKPDKPFEMKGTFDAVWVTGRIASNTAKKSVYIADGASDVDVGYALQAIEVEAYE